MKPALVGGMLCGGVPLRIEECPLTEDPVLSNVEMVDVNLVLGESKPISLSLEEVRALKRLLSQAEVHLLKQRRTRILDANLNLEF
jgi:hypothetical protein